MVKNQLVIEPTLDGSHTLYVPQLDEHYHSVNGAMQESKHVFINAGLLYSQKGDINILEIGFGTGLNVYLTYLASVNSDKTVNYTALELYPLELSVIDRLNYVNDKRSEEGKLFSGIHMADWDSPVTISDNFTLLKQQTDFSKLELSFDKLFDVIYFDAFSPDKQPEMWTPEIFHFLYKNTAVGGVLTTYCAKGVVRRMLQSVGYEVERLAGPPGKREILRAIKKNVI